MNIRNRQNSTPLHLALTSGAKSCIKLLLSAGANYNLQVFVEVSISSAFSYINMFIFLTKVLLLVRHAETFPFSRLLNSLHVDL